MGTTPEYDKLVEGFRAKISGNISSVKMTPEECAAEIAATTEGAFGVSEVSTSEYKAAQVQKNEDCKKVVEVLHASPSFSVETAPLNEKIVPKKKRGRPVGSRNKPKEIK